MPHCAKEESCSVRTLRHLDIEAGASGQFFKLTGSVRVIHPFGVFVDRVVRQLIRRYRNRQCRGIVDAVLGPWLVCWKIESRPDCGLNISEILSGRNRRSGVGEFRQTIWEICHAEAVRFCIENGAWHEMAGFPG